MVPPRLVFRLHAIERMFRRGVSIADVRQVVEEGEAIEEYPNDHPYPSRLIQGAVGERPLHVVVADNHEDEEIIVVTVYEPDPTQWDATFRKREKP